MLATTPSPLPRYSPNCSAILTARSSPSLTASNTFFADSFSSGTFLKTLGSSQERSALLASLTTPVAEAYSSRQPVFPQPQRSVSLSSTCICPISPPAPTAPVRISPFTIIPPPTPVPSVTAIRFLHPWPPPFHISPRAATFASFPAFTGRSRSSASVSRMLKVPQPRFTAPYTVPSPSMGPGAPSPTPTTSFFSISFSSIFALMLSAVSARISSPPFSFLVGISHLSSKFPSISKSPNFTVVPPTSTPNTYLPIISPCLSLRLLNLPHPCALPANSAHGCTVPAPRYIPSSSGGG